MFGGLLVLAGGVLSVFDWLRRRQAREHAADYVQRIQILKADRPMTLPAVKPLQGRKVKNDVFASGTFGCRTPFPQRRAAK